MHAVRCEGGPSAFSKDTQLKHRRVQSKCDPAQHREARRAIVPKERHVLHAVGHDIHESVPGSDSGLDGKVCAVAVRMDWHHHRPSTDLLLQVTEKGIHNLLPALHNCGTVRIVPHQLGDPIGNLQTSNGKGTLVRGEDPGSRTIWQGLA